jgi:hypothetical protein
LVVRGQPRHRLSFSAPGALGEPGSPVFE